MPTPVLEQIDQLGVFQILTGAGSGTGFLIDHAHLLTNCHVVAPYREVAVELRDRSRMLGTVLRLDPHRDLAIVRLAEPVTAEVLDLGTGPAVQPKQRVHILGFPVGLPLSLTEGVVSHARQLLDGQYFVQTDAAINPGNSGGPILDAARQVIAVTSCKLTAADSVGFGIPIDDVRVFVDAFRAQSEGFGVQCPSCTELIVEQSRYCPSCGADLDDEHDFSEWFEGHHPDPLVAFVESALTASGVSPVLARYGTRNWSLHSGTAPVRVWCCCSEHLNFSAPLALLPKKNLAPLYAHLLDGSHAPMSFDLNGSTIRLNLVVHTADVFNAHAHQRLEERVSAFLQAAAAYDQRLFAEFGCLPTPDTLKPH